MGDDRRGTVAQASALVTDTMCTALISLSNLADNDSSGSEDEAQLRAAVEASSLVTGAVRTALVAADVVTGASSRKARRNTAVQAQDIVTDSLLRAFAASDPTPEVADGGSASRLEASALLTDALRAALDVR